MDHETQQPLEELPAGLGLNTDVDATIAPASSPAPPEMGDGIQWVFLGKHGLRWGWSVALFFAVFFVELMVIGVVLKQVFGIKPGPMKDFTALKMSITEAISLLAVVGAAFVVALVEGRKLLDFNLRGPRGVRHFFAGLAVGFVALSALVGALTLGGWIHFGGFAISGTAIAINAVLWGICFLLVGCTEEGIFRCYLQSTMARGINFWQALVINALMCLDLILTAKGNGAWGIYAVAILGLIPCLWLFVKRVEGSGFWYAAWVTSTLFGFVHTGNGGENPVGIFQAAFVGIIFCISIKLTGSAWWAIGCHAGWDWAQTYFYGTPDSGMVGQGHLLNSTITGNPFWSGGADGPEGSILGVAALLLMLGWLLLSYGRGSAAPAAVPEFTAN